MNLDKSCSGNQKTIPSQSMSTLTGVFCVWGSREIAEFVAALNLCVASTDSAP